MKNVTREYKETFKERHRQTERGRARARERVTVIEIAIFDIFLDRETNMLSHRIPT